MKQRIITDRMITAYRRALCNDEKSIATVDKYMRDLRSFAVYAGGRRADKSLVLEYKAHLGAKYALSSANSMLAAVNSFFRSAGWYECCVKQFKIQKKTFCSEERELSRSEYQSLVRAAERKSPRLALVIQTICATGIRVSELSSITVEAVSRGEATVSCKGKTRRVFIISALRKKLLGYAREHAVDSGAVFVSSRGNPLNRSNIWHEMKQLCDEAGVSPCKVFPHNLRHLFARTFYGIEKDIAKLADILGHSNINTTRIYIISSGAEHRRKMENMHLLL